MRHDRAHEIQLPTVSAPACRLLDHANLVAQLRSDGETKRRQGAPLQQRRANLHRRTSALLCNTRQSVPDTPR